ncbi:hypothetical protein [Corynebacterium frankenforstense]|uniref:hypothetical protein n=1 Tax=Corynebacterium frankenforstense TaxID=1230998 RepID=UPI000A7D70FD|nr:hypothetical protein [Corynebacterium frankenforstense]
MTPPPKTSGSAADGGPHRAEIADMVRRLVELNAETARLSDELLARLDVTGPGAAKTDAAVEDARTVRHDAPATDVQHAWAAERPAGHAVSSGPALASGPTVPPWLHEAREPAQPPKPPLSTEQIVMRVAAVAGGLIVVVGLVLLLALAIQRGWLGPLGRVILAYAAALALLPAAVALDRRRRDGSAETAVAALSITSYAGVQVTTLGVLAWLNWWPTVVGALIAVVTFVAYLVLGLLLGWHRLLCAMAMIAPPVTWVLGDAGNLLLPLLWLQGGALFLAAVLVPRFDRHLRAVAALSAVLCLAPLRSATTDLLYPAWVPVTVLLGLAMAFLMLRRPPAAAQGGATGMSAWWFSAPVILLVMALTPPGARVPSALVALTALVPGALLGVHLLARPSLPTRHAFLLGVTTLVLIPLTTAVVAHNLADLGFSPLDRPLADGLRDLCVHLVVAACAVLAARTFPVYPPAPRPEHDPEGRHLAGSIPWWVWLALVVLLAAAPTADALNPLRPDRLGDAYHVLSALGLIVVIVAVLTHARRLSGLPVAIRWVAALVALGLTVTVTVTLVCATVFAVAPAAAGTAFLVTHGLVSVAWMAFGAWVLVTGARMPDNVSLAVGGTIAGAAVVKLVVYDLSAMSGLPRAFAFIVCGLILLGVVALRRSYAGRRSAGDPEAAHPAAAQRATGWGAPTPTAGTSAIEAGEAGEAEPKSGWGTPPRG